MNRVERSEFFRVINKLGDHDRFASDLENVSGIEDFVLANGTEVGYIDYETYEEPRYYLWEVAYSLLDEVLEDAERGSKES